MDEMDFRSKRISTIAFSTYNYATVLLLLRPFHSVISHSEDFPPRKKGAIFRLSSSGKTLPRNLALCHFIDRTGAKQSWRKSMHVHTSNVSDSLVHHLSGRICYCRLLEMFDVIHFKITKLLRLNESMSTHRTRILVNLVKFPWILSKK